MENMFWFLSRLALVYQLAPWVMLFYFVKWLVDSIDWLKLACGRLLMQSPVFENACK